MPENIVVALVEVDEIGRGHAPLQKREMIVFDFQRAGEKVGLIAEPGRSLINGIFQPGRGIAVTLDVQIGVADHVGQKERLDLLQSAFSLPFLGEMRFAVKAVLHKRHFHGKPAAAVRFDGLFGIIPHQPDAVAIVRLSPQLIGNLQQHRAGGSAIVGTDVGRVAEWIIRVVVAGDDDDAIFGTGEFGDDVVNR